MLESDGCLLIAYNGLTRLVNKLNLVKYCEEKGYKEKD